MLEKNHQKKGRKKGGGEMTQTLYAHMNKILKNFLKEGKKD
jgi:hypothetical protein